MRVLSLLMAVCGLAAAQDSAPASSNVPGAEYPRVHSDLRVTFRANAPGAQKVQLMPGGDDNGLGKGPFEMTRDDKGVWIATIGPVVPGFHYYWFVIDGFAANDPNSRTFFGWNKEASGIDVPEKGVDFYEIRDVPHGDLRVRWYYSKVSGMWRRVHLYTPPGYDSGNTRFPVLYLQHGSGESDKSWPNQGRVNFILDNLIAEKKAAPMLVVMENGMLAPRAGAPSAGTRRNEAFGDVVTQELIPFIDREYRTLADREHRALAGTLDGGGAGRADRHGEHGQVLRNRLVQRRRRAERGGERGQPEEALAGLVRRRHGGERPCFVRESGSRGDAEGGHSRRLVRIARDRARMADVAPVALRLRAAVVPRLYCSFFAGGWGGIASLRIGGA